MTDSEQPTPAANPTDVPVHLRGSITPEEWQRMCEDPERAGDVAFARWTAHMRGED